MSLIPISPTHTVRPGLELSLTQESVKEIRSKNWELTNMIIKQKSVKNIKVQNMLCTTALFYNPLFSQLLAKRISSHNQV